jgi:SAM-dependent methyltransferase
MAETQIRFEDGLSYERYMGDWSRRVGTGFLDWLALPLGLQWIDVGCGNGAFTELIVERCAPTEVRGIDPSEAQLDFARKRPAARLAKFERGDGMALPFPRSAFDVAIMALVIVFVPDPARGVAEMKRVVRPGWLPPICGTYWAAGSHWSELRAMGLRPVDPPSVDASRLEAMRDLWSGAGLEAVETREISVQRTFPSFEEFWDITVSGAPSLRPTLGTMSRDEVELLKTRVRARLPGDAAGRVTYGSRANAVKGRVPA